MVRGRVRPPDLLLLSARRRSVPVALNQERVSTGEAPVARKTRILILGGGVGGVYTAPPLEKLCKRLPEVETVLVSRDNFLLLTPLLFEVCSGTLDLRHCAFPVRAFLGTTRFAEGTVQSIDLERRTVQVSSAGRSKELTYDQLVLALGALTNQNMIPASHNPFTFKPLPNPLLLRTPIT